MFQTEMGIQGQKLWIAALRMFYNSSAPAKTSITQHNHISQKLHFSFELFLTFESSCVLLFL